MTREQATREARAIAATDGVEMVVAYNPYAEAPEESDRFSYFPAAAVEIFQYEEVVETIPA